MLAICLLLSACGAHHGAALIQTVPTGVEVVNMDDDTVIGITPVKVWYKEDEEQRKFVNIRLQKDGYRDKTASFWVTLRHSNQGDALTNPQFVEVELEKVSE
ncbi:MAG: hypothetical protein AAF402_01915 [Pseudomonadota bacterium]